jgi:two-component system sensor histidine kinase/response regulator
MPARTVVLVVDDEPKNIQVVGSLLLREGYEVIAARGGEEGIAKALETQPDLILLDVMMPGISGVEVAFRLKDHPEWNHAPIVFLSAATDKTFVIEGLGAGAVDYVTKPFNGPELLRRIELHVRLYRTQRKLEEAMAEKNRLVEVLAHDLKNPLGTVRFSARLLKEREVGDRMGELVDIIDDAAERALGIVESLLDERGLEYAREKMQIEWLSLDEVVVSVIEAFSERAADKKIAIEWSAPAKPVFVRADREALFRVLENLLSNALKFSPGGTRVALEVSREEDCGVFRIEDQGPGIPAHETGGLFQRYARLGPKPTGGESSTGLGLSIVKELTEAMAGSVEYRPGDSGGTEFRLALPAV